MSSRCVSAGCASSALRTFWRVSSKPRSILFTGFLCAHFGVMQRHPGILLRALRRLPGLLASMLVIALGASAQKERA